MSVKAHADNHLALLSNLSNLYETACSRQLHRLHFSGSHPQSLQSMAPEAYIFCLVYGYRNSIIKKTNMMFNVGGITINTSASLVNGWINISKTSLKQMKLLITDARGETVDLQNQPVSFTLLFVSL